MAERARGRLHYLRGNQAYQDHPGRTLLRLAEWRVRCLAGRGATVWIRGSRMALPPEWTGVAKLAFAFRDQVEPELDVLAALVQPGDTVVDVGASYGVYTLYLARLVGPRGTVVAIEPLTDVAEALRANLRRNGYSNVELHEVALSDRSGTARLHRPADPGRSSLGPVGGWAATAQVRTATLDDLLAGRQPSYVKLDIEGAEELVLRGAPRLVASQAAVIQVEVNPEAACALGLDPQGAVHVLERAGYELALVGRGRLVAAASAEGGNLVALPPARWP